MVHNVAIAGGASYLYSWSCHCWHKRCFILSGDYSTETGRTT